MCHKIFDMFLNEASGSYCDAELLENCHSECELSSHSEMRLYPEPLFLGTMLTFVRL